MPEFLGRDSKRGFFAGALDFALAPGAGAGFLPEPDLVAFGCESEGSLRRTAREHGVPADASPEL